MTNGESEGMTKSERRNERSHHSGHFDIRASDFFRHSSLVIQRFRARRISRRVGMDDCAPGRVTEIDAAATAKRIAYSRDFPSATAAAKAPEKQSPAPTVSIARTFGAGNQRVLAPLHQQTPAAPQVTRTFLTPHVRNLLAAVSTSDLFRVGSPVSFASSLSFGVSQVAC